MNADHAGVGSDRVVRLLVTGGGTGGHTYPALTAVRTAQSRFDGTDVCLDAVWVGTAGGLEALTAEKEGIRFVAVAAGKVRRARNPLKMVSWANIKDMAKVPVGVVQALRTVAEFKPDAVLATGGYVCVPVSLAAWACRRPVVVHEQTVRLGLANRVLARFATAIAVSSASTMPLLPARARARAAVTGNPVRPEILHGDAEKAAPALGAQGFDATLPTVYVTGGAQGAAQINRLVVALLPWLLERANVVHQCGTGELDRLCGAAAELPGDLAGRYRPIAFCGQELPDVFALADVVVARSGAGTIAELTALGLPSVLIPLASSAGGEQAHNARHLAQEGAAEALLGEADPTALREALEPLLGDAGLRAAMSRAALKQGRADAAERLVDLVLDVAPGGKR